MQIGTFQKDGNGYSGKIQTLTLSAEVKLTPNRTGSDKAPAFLLFHGDHEIGIAFAKTSGKGNEYLLVLVDDPSFAKPIWANLITSSTNGEFPLMWDRPQAKA